MTVKTWNIEAMTGYKPMTTYFEDFSIAERFGKEAIKKTFVREMDEGSYARSDYKVFTDFVMVLNWKIWQWYEGGNEDLARLYDKLWKTACQWVEDNFSDEEKMYYYRTTD